MRFRNALCLFAVLSGPLMAEPPAPVDEREALFRAADLDNSRSLSRSEVEAAMPKVIWRHFDEIDLNADAQLTPEELKTMAARQEQAREQRRAQRMRHLKGR